MLSSIATGKAMTNNEELKQTLKAKSRQALVGDLMSGICHEINNPLTILLGNLNILEKFIKKENGASSERLLLFTKEISTSTNRIQCIVSTLRQLAKAESADSKEKKDFREILEQVLIFQKTKITRQKIEVQVEGLEEAQEMACYPGLIVEALLHILNNSIEEVQNQNTKWIKIQSSKTEQGLEIFISDSAQAFKEADTQIFHSFFGTKEGHAGLGLTFAQENIEKNQGTIQVVTRNNQNGLLITLPFDLRDEK